MREVIQLREAAHPASVGRQPDGASHSAFRSSALEPIENESEHPPAYAGGSRGSRYSVSPHIPSGHLRVSTSDSPVSSRLLRLDRMWGQPLETASMSFDLGWSLSWMTVSLTDSPWCS